MTQQIDRWLLPDGVGEVLPPLAGHIEQLRRQVLDLYARWGYELIIPPLIEFTESLLVNTNRDLDLQTFKVTDQLSGRSMGIRADMTPQAARIDAHSLNRSGPVRLCYADSVLHTRPANAQASRSPIQLGVECFGITSLEADAEVISLMIETLQCFAIPRFVISLGHVEIFREIATQAGLDSQKTEILLDVLQRKASVELNQFVIREKLDARLANICVQLLQWNGDVSVLIQAKSSLAQCGGKLSAAIAELEYIAGLLTSRYPDVVLHVDLAELPGYHYHNGIVFAAYVEGAGAAVANGGRYDALCELFGRERPATGFNADLKTLVQVGRVATSTAPGIVVIADTDEQQWQAVAALRASGERVVLLPTDAADSIRQLCCDRQLLRENGHYVVKPL